MISLQIREDGVFIELEKNGLKQYRNIKPEELFNALNDTLALNKEKIYLKTPLLPPGTIKYQCNSNNDYCLFLYKEARIAPLIYEDRKYYIGYPNVIYKFTVNNNTLISTDLWAIDENIALNPKIPIYHFPFFNTYNDGRLCMGNNSIKIDQPWQLNKVPEILTVMPQTFAITANNMSNLTGDSLLKAIENKPFPKEWLKPTGKNLKNILV